MIRTVFPAWFQTQAATIDWVSVIRQWPQTNLKGLPDTLGKSPSRDSYQLRWMLAPQFGLPRAPFRVFFINANLTLRLFPDLAKPLSGGIETVQFAGLMARVVLVVNLTGSSGAAFAFSNDGKLVSVASATGTGIHQLSMDSGAISYILIQGSGSITGVFGITSDDLANDPAWKQVETVGLPVGAAAQFAGTGYDTSTQGLTGSPQSPHNAAMRRLASGAPLVGWSPLLPSGSAAPAWVPASPLPFVADQQATLLPMLVEMMQKSGSPVDDVAINLTASIEGPKSPGSMSNPAQASSASYSPLALLLMAASSDPFSALALGFGTAYTLAEIARLMPPAPPAQPPEKFVHFNPIQTFVGSMVTCDTVFNIPGIIKTPITLASIVLSNGQIEILPSAANLGAFISGNYPPQTIDQPWQESVQLRWDRPQMVIPVQSTVASYAVARALPAVTPGLLNRRRTGGGIIPYIPALAPNDAPDARVTYDDTQAPTTVPNASLSYSVVAQDWFGIWSPWASTSVTLPGEPLQYPALTDPKWQLTSDNSPFNASLSVQVAWDWTTRSPRQIDLVASLLRTSDSISKLPAGPVPDGVQKSIGGAAGTAVSITFNAVQQPSVSGGASITLVPTPSYNKTGHDMRVYLVTIPGFSLDFGGKNEIVGQIWAIGKANLHPIAATTVEPANARTLSPVRPPTPSLPQIVWASLPDPTGVSRVHLTWPSSAGASGYIVYQAAETRMIAVAEDAGFVPPKPPPGKPIAPVPDLTGPFADRVNLLRSLNMNAIRKAFTRVNSTATKTTETQMEVALPRGSKVIHAFVVTAVSANNIESPFPVSTTEFACVATPYVQIAQTPRIHATADAISGTITITLEQRGAVTPGSYQLLTTRRDDLATDAGLMGPPLILPGTTVTLSGPSPASPPASVTTTFVHAGVTPSWKRVWYRVIAVTDDNLVSAAISNPPWGALGGRSRPTEAVSVVLPPASPPAQPTVVQTGNAAGGNVLLTINTLAPAATTPLGSHILSIIQESALASSPAKNPAPIYIPLESPAFQAHPPASGLPGQLFRTTQAGSTIIGVRLATTATTTVTITLTDPLGRASVPLYLVLK